MKELRKVSQEELRGILELHKLWLETEGKEGAQADVSYCDLSNADLTYAVLTNANLRYANVSNANLKYANLTYADLRYSNVSNANLRYANLTNANLTNANLSDTNLRCADLRCADLTNADLSNTILYKTNLFCAKVDNMVGLVNVGNENRTVYYFYKDNRVICGSFDNTLEEFKKAVKEKYGEDYGSYAIAIEVFESMKNER